MCLENLNLLKVIKKSLPSNVRFNNLKQLYIRDLDAQ